MANIGGSQAGEFGLGVSHLTTGRANDQSITLGGSLQADSDSWDSMTPHGVLRTALGGTQDDGTWERLQRDAGGYEPGTMALLQDQADQGSNDNTA